MASWGPSGEGPGGALEEPWRAQVQLDCKNTYDLATGKTMYQLGIEQHGKDLAKSMEKINDTSRASENLGKFYKAESFQLDPNAKPKGISVFDFDE